MTFGYLVTGVGGATAKQQIKQGKESVTDVRVLPHGTWLPDWVPIDRAEHLVEMGLVTVVDLETKSLPAPHRPPFQATPNGISTLITALNRAGVETIPGLADYQRLEPLSRNVAPPDAPPSWLNLSVDEASDMLRERAYYRSAYKEFPPYRFAGELANEFAAILAENADILIDQMRPRFDQSVKKARELSQMGVLPEDTYQTLFQQSDKARNAWLEFRSRWAAPLDVAFTARQLLSQHTPCPPQVTSSELAIEKPAIDWSIVATHPYQPGALSMEPGTPSYQRWIRAAAHLHLASVSELDPSALASLEVNVPTPHAAMLTTDAPTTDEQDIA